METTNPGVALIAELLLVPVGVPAEQIRIIEKHLQGVDRDEAVAILAKMLADALDIGSILAMAVSRHNGAIRDAVKLRESLEFLRITESVEVPDE